MDRGEEGATGLHFLVEKSEMLPEGKVWVSIRPDVEPGGR